VRATDFSRPGWQIERLRVTPSRSARLQDAVLSRITTPQRLLIEARGIRVLEASGFVRRPLTEVAALEAAVSQPAIQACRNTAGEAPGYPMPSNSTVEM